MKDTEKISDYNQIAFLFSSVKNQKAVALAEYLEKKGINVYSPRSDMFFKRYEIRFALGCLMLMFPDYIQKLANGEFDNLTLEYSKYYCDCIQMVNEYLGWPANSELRKWIRQRGLHHIGLKGNTDYAYSGLLYQLLGFKPFTEILDIGMDLGVVDVRPARNLALLSQVISKYEYLHRINVLIGKVDSRGKRKIDQDTERLFNSYMRLLIDGGITEYEDDSEYAPSGCVSFMTIIPFPETSIYLISSGSTREPTNSPSDLLYVNISVSPATTRAMIPSTIKAMKKYGFLKTARSFFHISALSSVC